MVKNNSFRREYMEKFLVIMTFILTLCIIIMTCLTTKTYKYFANPDKIIFYDHGKERDIRKGSIIYYRILSLTAKRFERDFEGLLSTTEITNVIQMQKDQLMLEFIYSDMKETRYSFQLDPSAKFVERYNRIFMPLSGVEEKYFMFDRGEGMTSGTLTIASPKDVVKLFK
jgi:hypothetical protein